MRKSLSALPIISAALSVLTTLPASASAPGAPMHYTDGTRLCIRISHRNVLGGALKSATCHRGPQENLFVVKTGQHEFSFPEVKIRFGAGHCLGMNADNNHTALQNCGGPHSYGIIWDLDQANAAGTQFRFVNRKERQLSGRGVDFCLAGASRGARQVIHQCGTNHQVWAVPSIIG